MPSQKVLCVAEKPAIAKAVAQHLGGGQVNTVWFPTPIPLQTDELQRGVRGNQYVKNYEFDFNFRQWGQCSVTMTSVLGHLTSLDFEQEYKGWRSCQPGQLFDAPTVVNIDNVGAMGTDDLKH